VRSQAYELARCAVCGAAEAIELADADAVRAEVEALWGFHGSRLRPETPPALLADRVAFSQRPPLRLVRCRRCGLVYRNPRERGFELEEAYEEEAVDDAALESLHENQRHAYRTQARRLLRLAGRRGSGLEVGSYVGGFLAAAREVGWRFEGLDINERTNRFARSKGFAVSAGTLDTFEPGRRFDAVTIWNVFDQLPDPRAAAVRAHALLEPGGMLTVRVPNGAFYARLRPLLAGPLGAAARLVLAHSNLLSFPYRFGFTVESLRRLLHAAGFEVTRVYGDALVPTADRWTRRWATLEERAVKGAIRLLARREPSMAPWIEVYARTKSNA
jgi:2-polyprenyl-3-methyl-5-hydroxy-6-metoxy-1,4-benzoquinol methylase